MLLQLLQLLQSSQVDIHVFMCIWLVYLCGPAKQY